MTVLFWDIDGTLLTTGKAGVPAWDAAVREVTGREFALSSLRIAGMTDYQIAVRTFEMLGLPADASDLARLVQGYEARLAHTLPAHRGRVLPNVREILDTVKERADIRSYLLTGNTRGGARAKLTHYGLFEYFADGAFAEDTGERASIARRAFALAEQGGPVDRERVFVIGDTPHDVECANAIGVRTIAVATGGYSLSELEPHRPWRAMETLPSPAEFLTLIDAPDLNVEP
jgi:phosphoglycolate phosphatase-like HAD superfamily hydrolase